MSRRLFWIVVDEAQPDVRVLKRGPESVRSGEHCFRVVIDLPDRPREEGTIRIAVPEVPPAAVRVAEIEPIAAVEPGIEEREPEP